VVSLLPRFFWPINPGPNGGPAWKTPVGQERMVSE
jgi:hypothetical protein